MGCLRIVHDQRPEIRVVHGKKGVTSNDWVKRVCSSYLFGMLMPDRHDEINGNPYTYGFQGQERDDEVKGAGNAVNYKYRMHDPRLGRWPSVDPEFDTRLHPDGVLIYTGEIEDRPDVINVYDSDSKKQGAVSGKEDRSILKDEKKR